MSEELVEQTLAYHAAQFRVAMNCIADLQARLEKLEALHPEVRVRLTYAQERQEAERIAMFQTGTIPTEELRKMLSIET